jgi:hypothetical protein
VNYNCSKVAPAAAIALAISAKGCQLLCCSLADLLLQLLLVFLLLLLVHAAH